MLKVGRHISTIVLVALSFLSTRAADDDIRTVEASYRYVVPENCTVEMAELTALDRAKIQAIEEAFGTRVSQDNTTLITTDSRGESDMNFISLGGSQIQGEWIETIEKPHYEYSRSSDMLIITVTVKGRIRRLDPREDTSLPMDVKVMCNGLTPQNARTEFRDGDQLYASFRAPVGGYLAIYLLDYATKRAYRMLPYRNNRETARRVMPDIDYLFFSPAHDTHPAEVDEYVMICSNQRERNDLIYIFSERPFSDIGGKPLRDMMPIEMDLDKFIENLARLRKNNSNIQTRTISITISK